MPSLFTPPLRIFISTLILCSAAGAESKTKDDAPTEAEKKAELEKKQAEEQAIKAEFNYEFSDIADKLVIITCSSERGRSSGSGFIATMNGKPYLFTNQHVILGADKIRFKTASGRTLKPRGIELAAKRDIARLPLDPAEVGLPIGDNVSMAAPIGVFGNSEGGGVATELYGKTRSIGAEKIEVSAEFVSGNSGSPVLNQNKEVIAIASYVSWKTTKKKGTETRRFCYRLTDERWHAVNWKKYNDQYGKQLLETEALIDSIVEIVGSWYVSPGTRIDADSHPIPSLRLWSRDHNQMVNKIENMLDQGSCSTKELDAINRKIRKDLIDSAAALSKVCSSRSRCLKMSNAKQKDMTGFLHNEFEQFADRLNYVSKAIDRYGIWLKTYNYFHFRKS